MKLASMMASSSSSELDVASARKSNSVSFGGVGGAVGMPEVPSCKLNTAAFFFNLLDPVSDRGLEDCCCFR